MATDSRSRRYVIGAVVVAVVAAAVAFPRARGAEPPPYETSVITWGAPASGAPAVRYVLRIADLATATEDTVEVVAQPGAQQTYTFTRLHPEHEYRACTAGIDARGRQGLWSAWSPVYSRVSAPSRP
jgi:hypothetical protein